MRKGVMENSKRKEKDLMLKKMSKKWRTQRERRKI